MTEEKLPQKVNLLGFDAEGLKKFCEDLGEKPFRAKQLERWIHRRGARDFSEMTDLAKSFRAKLEKVAEIRGPEIIRDKTAADGTRKWLLDVGNGNAVEMVYIPQDGRGTLCVSSQAGCAMNCLFCSTGKQGFNRNLKASEIIGQLWHAEHTLRKDLGITDENERVISNVVMMGMGEPLQNLDAVIPSLKLMLDDNAYGLSRRRVTVSTSGLVRQMDKLAEQCPVALAVSLHAPNNELRDKIMPINRKHPLEQLRAILLGFLQDLEELCGVKMLCALEETVTLHGGYRFGGSGKVEPELQQFTLRFAQLEGIFVEKVYTGKTLYGVCDLAKQGYFPAGACYLHSGGLGALFSQYPEER